MHFIIPKSGGDIALCDKNVNLHKVGIQYYALLFWLYLQQGIISFGDLFMAPNFDELEEVAIDSNGQPKLLTNKQLGDVRQMG